MTDAAAHRFNWRLVLGVAFLGLVFAALTITGSIPDRRTTYWVALGLLAVEAQALCMTTYFENNPQYLDLEMPFDWPPRLVTAVLGPSNAVVAAVIDGALAWLIWKIRQIRSSASG